MAKEGVIVVCRRCGPESLAYSGRIEWRLCPSCVAELKRLEKEGWR